MTTNGRLTRGGFDWIFPKRGWKGAPGIQFAPVLLALGGLVLSGVLTLVYAEFYDALGVRPSDVGYTYATALPNAAGLAFLLAVVVLLAAGVAYLFGGNQSITWGAVGVLFAVVVAVAAGFKVKDRIRAVLAGDSVAESRVGLLVLLALHAEPVHVVFTDGKSWLPASVASVERPLLLLGKDSGTVVVYSAISQRSFFIPAGSVVLEVSDCRAPETLHAGPAFNPACLRLHS